MKWKRNGTGDGQLGMGYTSGDFKIFETYDSYNLQKEFGGKRSDYYWVLKKGDKILGYASTAKALKKLAEEN